MELSEIIITQAIVDRFWAKFKENIEMDVAIVGGGPAGLVAGYFLAKAGKKGVSVRKKIERWRWNVGWRHDV